MSWRRWNKRDTKYDVREYLLEDRPHLPGLPSKVCGGCALAAGIRVPEWIPEVVLVRKRSKRYHYASKWPDRGLNQTLCGRYYKKMEGKTS